jgi:hypothetical protein
LEGPLWDSKELFAVAGEAFITRHHLAERERINAVRSPDQLDHQGEWLGRLAVKLKCAWRRPKKQLEDNEKRCLNVVTARHFGQRKIDSRIRFMASNHANYQSVGSQVSGAPAAQFLDRLESRDHSLQIASQIVVRDLVAFNPQCQPKGLASKTHAFEFEHTE